nr:DIM1 family protein [Cryptomonas sp.]
MKKLTKNMNIIKNKKHKLQKNYINSVYGIDQAILDEEEKILCIVFQNSLNVQVLKFKKMILKFHNIINRYVVVYYTNTKLANGYDLMYELFKVYSVIFFFRNKRIIIDTNTGNNNKLENLFLNSSKFIKYCEIIFWNINKGKNAVYLF